MFIDVWRRIDNKDLISYASINANYIDRIYDREINVKRTKQGTLKISDTAVNYEVLNEVTLTVDEYNSTFKYYISHKDAEMLRGR